MMYSNALIVITVLSGRYGRQAGMQRRILERALVGGGRKKGRDRQAAARIGCMQERQYGMGNRRQG